MKRENKVIKDNRGFTLVELVISMAMFAVVAGAIMMFMYAGSNSYSYAKTEVDLQMQSQTLMAQVTTMIQESNNAVYDADKKALILYNIKRESVADAEGKYSIVKSVKSKKVIYQKDSNLYLETFSTDATPTYSGSEENLLSNYMNTFAATVKDDKVTIKWNLKNKKQTFATDSVTVMRNGFIEYP